MAEIALNKNKIDAVVKVATLSVTEHVGSLETVEALIGFSEVVGRVIAATPGTSLLHRDMIKLAMNHIEQTVKASYEARGNSGEGLYE